MLYLSLLPGKVEIGQSGKSYNHLTTNSCHFKSSGYGQTKGSVIGPKSFPSQGPSYPIPVLHLLQFRISPVLLIYYFTYKHYYICYRIVGNFRGEISSWFSIIKVIHGKKFVVYSSVPSQLNDKIKSSWVKHLWFYSNHEDISPRKFSAIWYVIN